MERIKNAIDYFSNGQFESAEKIALEVLKKFPDNIDAIDIISAVYLKTNKSILLEKGGNNEIDYIRKVAKYLNDLKMYSYSMDFYKKSLSIKPRDYIGYNNLGLLYENMNDDENAKKCYEKSIKIQYNYFGLYNLGIYYRKRKDTENAIKYVKKALALRPDDWQTNYSLGMLYFMKSDFENGYKYFLKRKTKGIENLKNFWDGTFQKDKTVLVYCDYGFGDAIMYSRYFPFLKNYFKSVKVACSDKLKKLFQSSMGDIEFVSVYLESDYDYCVLAMNLPYYLKMDFTQIPFSNGYLKVKDDDVEEFRKKYFDNEKFKIGLFWIGGEKEKRVARTRFMELSELKEIVRMKNFQFYSLQVDDPFNDIQFFPEIVDLGKNFRDFYDTACAIQNLDLVISIDSAVIHLSGALGKKAFLMLPKSSEWRWFLDEKKTVWYDSVELFVQDKLYDWSSVTDKIKKKLTVNL
ncbi:tetratricopeptide repeat protein [bacterium]|nr:tetratricopeptide repeat protein [bacterium]